MPAAEPTDHLVHQAHRLGDLVNGHPEHVDAVVPQLVGILTTSDDWSVVQVAVEALGHTWHPSAATALLDHVGHDHPDLQVRLALAQALPGGVDVLGDLRDRVIDVLTSMIRDPEPRVRDWAAFGLGQLQARSRPALDALAALLADPDHDTRGEALQALADAGDARVLPILRRRLEDSDELSRIELQAAAAMAAADLHPALRQLAQDWAEDQDEFSDLLATALARCAPGASGTARQVDHEALARVHRLLAESHRVTLEGSYPRTVLAITSASPGEGMHLSMWSNDERPDEYPIDEVVHAVCAGLSPPQR